jgi:hypothetical protein
MFLHEELLLLRRSLTRRLRLEVGLPHLPPE